MKVIEGHLTATNKKAIKAILSAGLTSGKVGRISYFLFLTDGIWTVKIQQKDRGIMPVAGSPLRLSTYVAQFIYTVK
jgi:hypothetical protein